MIKNRIVRWFLAKPPIVKVSLMVGADAVFLPLCMLLALAIRIGSFEVALGVDLPLQIALALLTIPALGTAGLYRTVVRYLDVKVLVAAGVALAAAVLLTYGFIVAFNFDTSPRSGLLVFWFVAFAYVVTSRFLIRALLQRTIGSQNRGRIVSAIYGAGSAGVQLAHAMQYSMEYQPVCFFDDNHELGGKTVAVLPVYPTSQIEKAIQRHGVAQIVIAIPSATAPQKARLEHLGVPIKILPNLSDWVDGSAKLTEIRDLDVADLLGRDPVPPNNQLISRNITNKVVMVTGAGGSIGSELCRQIIAQHPKALVLLDHSEYALYAIDQELRATAPALALFAALGSVQDEHLLFNLITEHSVQTVYHAAAYKHVPIVEANVRQGLQNNVFGTLAVANASRRADIETCVLISTDKAVRPTNAMGASKRVAELVIQAAALQAKRTRFSMVRFGNVLGSSGSVVPLFRRQLIAGGPITLTHPDIIRYFMLIPEAAQLVIQAGAMARGGEVFVLDMGDPVRIVDLARSMIHLSGLTERTAENPDGDIEIKAVGLRPGEKLYEELLIGHDVTPSGHSRILCARERHIEPSLLEKMLESLHQACLANDTEAMRRQLMNLVPEYRNADEVNAERAQRVENA
jgi:FlaA1/EpsC-like NDP-sugar epimerase